MWADGYPRLILLSAVAAGLAMLATWLSGVLVRRAARGRYERFLTTLHEACHRPWGAVLLVAFQFAALPLSGVSSHSRRGFYHVLVLALICASAWLAVKVLFVAEDFVFRRLPVDVADNRRRRRARTQIGLLRRLTAAVITTVALAATLMTFHPLRAFGASLLASAGVAGVVAGLAAHSMLGHVFAGLQLAFTDHLRLDDVVVVENEWGRIEEMRLTYVVVRLWDERRLILPTTYFTATPFQNWTRNEARVLGEVILHLDYRADVERLRVEARRIVEESPLWDRRDWVLQVVESTPTDMVVRVLASAADGPSSWDLRCEVREGLINFVKVHEPQWLPRARAEVTGGDSDHRAAGYTASAAARSIAESSSASE